MGEFRRLPAALFLMLHLVVGMRPAVTSAATTRAAHPAQSAAMLSAAASANEHAGHSAHATHEAPSSDEVPPSPEHSSHHDAGCHGAPCCAPVMPHGQIRAIATRDVPVARQRPLVGAGRVVFADGARRRPPATAPPVALNA